MRSIIECQDIDYQQLNALLRSKLEQGERNFTLKAVCGQRYLAAGLSGVTLNIEGTPGNNLAAMMNGATIQVKGNAQDGLGNTMNEGKVVVWGNAGDLVGYGMRGGIILIKGRVGSRVGIHMKGSTKQPAIVVGGNAGDFLGEYMAGGRIVILGLGVQGTEGKPNPAVGRYLATGIHGGKIYVRGFLAPEQLSGQVMVKQITLAEDEDLMKLVAEWTASFGEEALPAEQLFTLIQPAGVRPYGHIYKH